jgi:hypothetical protein
MSEEFAARFSSMVQVCLQRNLSVCYGFGEGRRLITQPGGRLRVPQKDLLRGT